jgi:transcriptional regulator with XRE-family HTH domain
MKVFLPDSPIAEPFMTKFYAKLVALMEVRRLVPATLAKVAGVDKQKISRWKTGTLPAIDDALRVARTLGVPLDFLSDDEMKSPPAVNGGTKEGAQIIELVGEIGVDAVLEILKDVKRMGTEKAKLRLLDLGDDLGDHVESFGTPQR